MHKINVRVRCIDNFSGVNLMDNYIALGVFLLMCIPAFFTDVDHDKDTDFPIQEIVKKEECK